MRKVLLAQKIHEDATELLKQHAEVVLIPEGDIEQFKKELADSYAVVLGTSIRFTSELMDMAPELKIISRTGVGVDNVDSKAASERGILVLFTPEANAVSVAEHTVSLICALAKHIVYLDDQVRKNNFGARRQYLPVDLDGKTLGLIGCGRIGTMVAKKCIHGLGMEVIAYDPMVKTAQEGIVLKESMEEIFIQADFISLHIPLIEQTRNLVNEKLISLMKPSAFLVNTARGGIVDEKALVEMLNRKRIAGAATDVFEKEPPDSADTMLLCENLIMTPHTAALTKECTARVAKEAVKGIIEHIDGRTPKFVYNKEVLL